MGFARWIPEFFLKNSRAPPILRHQLIQAQAAALAHRAVPAPIAAMPLAPHGRDISRTSPPSRKRRRRDDKPAAFRAASFFCLRGLGGHFVGWVKREIVDARTHAPSARNPCCRDRLFSGRCQALSAHGRMGFARWIPEFFLKNSRAPPILRHQLIQAQAAALAHRAVPAPIAAMPLAPHGRDISRTSPPSRKRRRRDDKPAAFRAASFFCLRGLGGHFVGWVKREIVDARTHAPSARNPCGRDRLFSSRCQALSAHGRMGCARWIPEFFLKNSRAPPILRHQLIQAQAAALAHRAVGRADRDEKPAAFRAAVFFCLRGLGGHFVGWVKREIVDARTHTPSARNPCCRDRLFSGRCQAL